MTITTRLAATALAAGILASGVVATAPVASAAESTPAAVQILARTPRVPSVTVLNHKINVYRCSYVTRRCTYWFWYQINGPYNSSVGTYWTNEYRWGWWWV